MTFKLTCGKGGENLNEFDKDLIKRLHDEHYSKFLTHLKEINSFDIHLKCHQKEGNIKRYEIMARITSPNGNFEASSENWELKDAVHKTLEKLHNEIEHRIHFSDQNKKVK